MTEKDYYELLEVSRDADSETIKKSYRRLAMKYHPDRNPGDKEAETKFKEINEAYDVLKDSQKRAAYDRYGHQAFAGGAGGNPFNGFEFNFGSGGFSDIFADVFSEFMGGGRRGGQRSYAQRGEDVRYNLSISLEEAFSGVVNKDKTLKVKIPAGIEDNTRMRIPGAGEAGSRGGENGDLYVFITVKPHKIFSREGANLYMRVPVSMACAALGGKLEIPAIDGSTIELSVPAGTQSDQIQKIGGEGMTVIRAKGRGDLFVKYRVETPVNLSAKQKELLEQFREISKDDSCQPETKGFFDKIKDLFNKAS